MNLFTKLQQRGEEGALIKVGMIGGGKFGTMFLSQAIRLPGIHVVGIADLSPAAVRSNLELLGWPSERYNAANINEAAKCSPLRRYPYEVSRDRKEVLKLVFRL